LHGRCNHSGEKNDSKEILWYNALKYIFLTKCIFKLFIEYNCDCNASNWDGESVRSILEKRPSLQEAFGDLMPASQESSMGM